MSDSFVKDQSRLHTMRLHRCTRISECLPYLQFRNISVDFTILLQQLALHRNPN